MAKPTSSVEQVIDLVGHSVGAATSLLVTLAQQLGYTVAPTSPGVYRLARTRKKLLGRSDEALTARVYEARSGPGIRLVGDIADDLVAHLRNAAAAAPPPAAFKAEPNPVALAQRTALEPPQAYAPQPAPDAQPAVPMPPPQRGWVVDLPDGRSVPVAVPLLVGRGPDNIRGPLGCLVVAIADPSVSKTHCLLDPKGAELAVTDLYSTNGTRLDLGTGSTWCTPGTASVVAVSGVVFAGDARLVIRAVQ